MVGMPQDRGGGHSGRGGGPVAKPASVPPHDRGLAREMVVVVGVSLAVLAAGVVWAGWFGLRGTTGEAFPPAALADIRGVNAERPETLEGDPVVRVVVEPSLSRENLEHTITEVRRRFPEIYGAQAAGRSVAPVIQIGTVLLVPGSERLSAPVVAGIIDTLRSDELATEIRLAESLRATLSAETTPTEALQELRLLTRALPAAQAVPGGYAPRVESPGMQIAGYGDLDAAERLVLSLSTTNLQITGISLTYGRFSAEAPDLSTLSRLRRLEAEGLEGWTGRISAPVMPPRRPAGGPELPGGWDHSHVVIDGPIAHLPRFAPPMAQMAEAGIGGTLSLDRDQPGAYLARFAPASPEVEEAVSRAFAAEELGASMARTEIRVRCNADHGGLCPMEVVQVTMPVPVA